MLPATRTSPSLSWSRRRPSAAQVRVPALHALTWVFDRHTCIGFVLACWQLAGCWLSAALCTASTRMVSMALHTTS